MTSVRWLACLALLSVGCDQHPAAREVHGSVRVDGRAAEGVYVVLTEAVAAGAPPTASATARTDPDGAFKIRVSSDGPFAVTAFWPSVLLDDGSVVEGPDRFGGRYRDPIQPVTTFALPSGDEPATMEPINLSRR
ncbi:hypothetical protein Pla123a_05140 [Posidoniimonas polymericola]|uniref:Nickel uptake substrate-specific transmembrane region n=1 Tax=Posidoniimonas polymericola TaxID=2528002 RepID=A0A5C5ZF68_9BACT|nr:hypothetical protein [Posidoniimonas polymericola]TWT85707.1 hypothetical protein Pla123a_05140 [Posidoniimonas polymericola]